jgi:hypothetical protein
MSKLKLPKVAGFYKAKVQGAWEPVSFFKHDKKNTGVILVGDRTVYTGNKIADMVEEFGEKIDFPEDDGCCAKCNATK